MNDYEELYTIIVGQHGIDPDMKLERNGYYMTMRDYIRAVSERGGAHRIIPALKSMPNKEMVLSFMKGASTRIITGYLDKDPDFYKYYKNIIKKIS